MPRGFIGGELTVMRYQALTNLCERHPSIGQSTGSVNLDTSRSTFKQTKRTVVERGSSAVECRTRNQVSPGSNPSLLPFRILGIFVLSIDAPVDSAV